mmetsp:Transcript_19603/g.45612  ORF Transcript_19603/g.45612 Transcript_19603/m.45612 type:complete len:759 (+) Transcript_19603:83-2359(+)
MSGLVEATFNCCSSRDKKGLPEKPCVEYKSKGPDFIVLHALLVDPPDAKVQGLDVQLGGVLTWSDAKMEASRLDNGKDAYSMDRGTWKIELQALQPSTEYDIRARGFNMLGHGDWTRLSLMTAVAPAAPVRLKCAQRHPTKLELQWEVKDPEGAPVSSCAVYIRGALGWSAATFCEAEEPRRKANDVWEATVSELVGASVYQVGVVASNAAGQSPWEVQHMQTSEVPMQPYPVECKRRMVNELEITWVLEEPDGAPIQSCLLQQRGHLGWYSMDAGESGSLLPAQASPGKWVAVVRGLEGDTAYNFRVRGENEVGAGPWSVRTFSTSRKPSSPTDLICKSRMPDGLALAWRVGDPVGDDAAVSTCSVQIRWMFGWAPHDFERAGSLAPKRTGADWWEATLTGLDAETTYEVKVSGINPAGEGQGLPASFTTSEKPPAPEAFACRARFADSLELSWEAADTEGAPVVACSLQVNGSFGWRTPEFASGMTPRKLEASKWGATVNNLDIDTIYTLRVRAENAVGPGAWSEPMDFKTQGRADSPFDFAWRLDGDQVRLTWHLLDPPGAPVLRCELELLKDDDNMLGSVYWSEPSYSSNTARPTRSSGDTWTAAISKLKVGKLYKVRICAHNAAGRGRRFEGIVQMPEAPPAPTTISCAKSAQDVLHLEWCFKDSGGAQVLSCNVQVLVPTFAFGSKWQDAPFAPGFEPKRESVDGMSQWRCAVTNCSPGTSELQVRIRGQNKLGDSEWTVVSLDPATGELKT